MTKAAPENNFAPPPVHAAPPPPVHATPPPPGFIPLPIWTQTTANTPWADDESRVHLLLEIHDTNKGAWDHMVGWYFQEFGRSPGQIIGPPTAMLAPAPCGWEQDLRKLDILEKNITAAEYWLPPAAGTIEARIIEQVKESDKNRQLFEEAIRRWANSLKEELSPVLIKACFTKDLWTDAWVAMHQLKIMEEGPAKERELARAKAESPRYYERCMNDETCGR